MHQYRLQDLESLLLKLFNQVELRRFVQYGPSGQELISQISCDPFATMVGQVVTAWHRRGLINTHLFRRLMHFRDGRAADILSVAQSWCIEGELTKLEPIVVLLVEDDEIASQSMGRRLEHAGFDVLHAKSVKEAVQLTRKHRIDLGIFDETLPGGLGSSIARDIAARNDQIRCILVTGGTFDESIRAFAHSHPQVVRDLIEGERLPERIADSIQRALGESSKGPMPESTPLPTPTIPLEIDLTDVTEDAKRLGVTKKAIQGAIERKYKAHPLMFLKRHSYIEISFSSLTLYVQLQNGSVWARRLLRIPVDEHGRRWISLYESYAEFYRHPYRDPDFAGRERYSELLFQAVRHLECLIQDAVEFAIGQGFEWETQKLQTRMHRLNERSPQMSQGDLVAEMEFLLSSVHSLLDTSRPESM